MKYKCLSIAGFDNSGGAGLQADLKTFSALGCYGMTAVTAIAVQNTCGVRDCYPIPERILAQQLETIFDDITPDCIKIGMLFNNRIIETVTRVLNHHAGTIPMVLDPVMVSKNGEELLRFESQSRLVTQLLPHATLITPNLYEAYKLAGNTTGKSQNQIQLAGAILDLGPQSVLIKGGHSDHETADDLFMEQHGAAQWLTSQRVQTYHTHGTGCTLSAAIAAYLAQGAHTFEACHDAKRYLTSALSAVTKRSVGHGTGPVHHFYNWW